MHLGLTKEEWRRLHIMNGVITAILFMITFVTAPMGFYPALSLFTRVLGVIGVIVSGLLYVASVWRPAIRPVTYVAMMTCSLCPILGVLAAGFVLRAIRSLL